MTVCGTPGAGRGCGELSNSVLCCELCCELCYVRTKVTSTHGLLENKGRWGNGKSHRKQQVSRHNSEATSCGIRWRVSVSKVCVQWPLIKYTWWTKRGLDMQRPCARGSVQTLSQGLCLCHWRNQESVVILTCFENNL